VRIDKVKADWKEYGDNDDKIREPKANLPFRLQTWSRFWGKRIGCHEKLCLDFGQ
jgi:hypothetical protein